MLQFRDSGMHCFKQPFHYKFKFDTTSKWIITKLGLISAHLKSGYVTF
jgi:hypothetical protein